MVEHKRPKLLKQLLKDARVATIAPSSPSLVKKILEGISFKHNLSIVEYGPGNGPITKEILKRMTPDSRLIALERNKDLFEYLVSSLKDTRLDIRHLEVEAFLKNQDSRSSVDYVISGIPFSMFSIGARKAIVEETRSILKPSGTFILYQTTRLMRAYLRKAFENVSTKRVWRNIPPMYIILASKPIISSKA